MASRRHLIMLVVLGVVPLMGAQFATQNFLVEAPTPQIAQQIGQAAEHYRKEKAILWLGREMPPWPERCPLRVQVTMSGAGGATSFAYDRGRVLGQHMNIEGSLDRLLASVLPHEVTHTVFAHYFRCPVPRWSDEGGAVLSEDEIERNRHDMLVRQILNTPGRAIPLRRLFALKEYPSDVMCLYAQGYSVSNYLVESSNRQTFLALVAMGMQEGWDKACQTYYRCNRVEELEQAWLAHLRETRRPPAQLARNTIPVPTDPASRVIVRQTAPPAQPLAETASPIYRGQAPSSDYDERYDPARRQARGRPGYLPAYDPSQPPPASLSAASAPTGTWQPPGVPIYQPPSVQLGQPQPIPVQPEAGWQAPGQASPVGYPR